MIQFNYKNKKIIKEFFKKDNYDYLKPLNLKKEKKLKKMF